MNTSEKGALAAMVIFAVLLLMEYLDKCLGQIHGFSLGTGVALVGLLVSGLMLVIGRVRKKPNH